jgi:hypothetical protein
VNAKAKNWGLENSTLKTITDCARGHVTTELDGRVHESHERIDCQQFPFIYIHFNDDGHFLDESASVEVLIKKNLALSVAQVRLHGSFKKPTSADLEKNGRTFVVQKVQEMEGVRVVNTVEAPDLKNKTAQ